MDRNIINPWTQRDDFGFLQANHPLEFRSLCCAQARRQWMTMALRLTRATWGRRL